MKSFLYASGLCLLAACLSPLAHADGISTPFADIEATPIAIGHHQSVQDSEGHGLRVKNLGAAPIHIAVEVLVPQTSQLRPGAAPIPDTHWIEARPSALDLAGHEEKECQIVLNVPRKKEYRGRYYQAMIWSHGVPSNNQGFTISGGLLSRVRFRIKK